MKRRTYSIVCTSAIEAYVNQEGMSCFVIREDSPLICDFSQPRSDSNMLRILSTRLLNSGSTRVASVIFSMLWITVE